MNINWSEIKERVKIETQEILFGHIPNGVSVSEAIILFQKVIYCNHGGYPLAGLARSLPNALEEALIKNVGSINPLKIIADNLEPFLKKIVLLGGLASETQANSMTLIPLLKMININAALSAQTGTAFPMLNETNLAGFKGQPEFLEYIADAYITRNKVHESPNFSMREIMSRQTSILIVYLISAAKYKSQIDSLPDGSPSAELLASQFNEDERYLYHFVTFGATTNKIRNQIVTAYILNYLYQHQQKSIEEIRSTVNVFFQTNMNSGYFERIIEQLRREQKVQPEANRIYSLTSSENKRIQAIQADFEENRNIFLMFLEDIGRRYGIVDHLPKLLEKLQEFIENNYSLDINEAYNRVSDLDKEENNIFQELITYLQEITDKETAPQLFKELAVLSEDSDFLLRICASKTFAMLTNPERFEQYINMVEREVFLDTQIILFALCLNYVHDAKFENYYYQSTEELISLAKRNPNIKLKVSRLYLKEVAYQLKLALMLIPFTELNIKSLSSNVFYQFYLHLRDNSLLEDGDSTYADFMKNWFKLYEDDAYDPTFYNIAFENINEFLADQQLNIEVVTIPQYDNRPDAVSIINKVILEETFRYKPKHVIDNDAIMLCYLCDSEEHAIEPFFLTWDKSFTKYRKEYTAKFQRANPLSFHLFTPSRFINHYSLIGLKINPKGLTDDFLSIMDSYNIHERTQTIWDSINKFLNIESINTQQRRRYITTIKDIFERELDYHDADQEKSTRIAISLDDTLSRINDYYTNNSKYTLTDFKDLILSEEYFDKTANLIVKSLTESELNTVAELDKIIAEFKEGLLGITDESQKI